jgi:protein-S-isoprenylcysteine O-methyltransferase Ste14
MRRAMRALELKIPPPLVALLIGTAMWHVSRSGPSLDLPLIVRSVAGLALAVLGAAIALAGDIEFRRARTTINPWRPHNTSSLVTTGVYRHTRNPMYLGLLVVLCGWAVFLASAWPLAGPPAFVLYISRFQIHPEEGILSAKFGSVYADYASRVRRWL